MLNELSNASGLNKKMKTKKDCFKHFNHAKVILNKKKNKPASNVCKRLQRVFLHVKITRLIQKYKIIVFLVLFFSVFSP